MRSGTASDAFVGRHDEVAVLRDAVDALRHGRGGAVWVEGEAGIGKSALLAQGLAGTGDACELAWGQADELTERFPHRVILDCLRIESRSADPARAVIAATLRGEHSGSLLVPADPALAVTEGLLDLVDHVCAQRPVVLVVDDLHWADDASLTLWRRLAATVRQQPLLLVSSCRPASGRDALAAARAAVVDGPGRLLAVPPLDPTEVGQLVTDLVGAPPGPTLRALTAHATGNPLYLRELIDALVREQIVQVENGLAEVPVGSGYEPPSTLAAAVARRLGFLSPHALETLQVAALLGPDFGIAELALISGAAPADLAATVDEVIGAGVVIKVGPGRLSFRHLLIRQAFHDRTPAAVRSALHRHVAQVLAEAQAPVERVAAQLAATTTVDKWVIGWLSGVAAKLISQAPQVAADLLGRAVEATSAGDSRRDALLGGLTRVSFRLGRDTEARRYARLTLAEAHDPGLVAEARWLLSYMQGRAGEAEALDTLDQALADPALPEVWQARLYALQGMAQGNFRGDLDLAEATAKTALARAEAVDDRFAMGYALHCMAWLNGLRRDNARQAALIDRALRVLGDDRDHVQLRLILHHNRMYALTVLDRIADAGAELAKARVLAERTGNVEMAGVIHVTAAVHYFWTGRWDDSLAELDAVPEHPISYMLLVSSGLKALLAIRRDDRTGAAQWLATADEQPIAGAVERDNCHFLLAARAAVAERNGDPAAALRALALVLEPDYAQMTLRYWLLPDLVRLALANGDRDTAVTAAGICETEAVQEPTAGKAAAANHCRGLLAGDAAPLLAAAEHYRAVGRTVELARALDDAAVLLAAADHVDRARTAHAEAVGIYAELNATWDIRRADSLVRPYGIRRGARGPRRRPAHGWNALSPTEIAVANLVARGLSNPDIAAELLLSRRTVQSHVSHILYKLNAQSRIEIAREALRH